VGADRMVGDHSVDAKAAGQQQLPDVDVDADEHPAHLAVKVDLRVGWGFVTAGQLVGHGHDLAQPHVGIIGFRIRRVPANPGMERRGEGGFAPTFKEAVGRWRRRHRHPPANETWFAVHYRVGWLVERLSYLESIHLLRQGLDVRSLSAERPARRRKDDAGAEGARHDDEEGIDVEDEPADAVSSRPTGTPGGDGG
jgi:hypothetical protein